MYSEVEVRPMSIRDMAALRHSHVTPISRSSVLNRRICLVSGQPLFAASGFEYAAEVFILSAAAKASAFGSIQTRWHEFFDAIGREPRVKSAFLVDTLS
jgi:hypothetical protein